MRIAMPVDDNNMDTTVCPSFGRCPFYLIYDTEAKTGEFLINTAAKSAGGAGIRAAQLVVDSHVDSALAPRCGQNAANVLQAANIKLYQTNSNSVKESIASFEAGDLPLLAEIHAGFHGHK